MIKYQHLIIEKGLNLFLSEIDVSEIDVSLSPHNNFVNI